MSDLPRIAIEGYLRQPDGTPMANATVIFTLSHTDTDLTSDTVVLAHPVSVRTNDQGFLSAMLWANDRGFQNSHYTVAAIVRQSRQDTQYELGRMQVSETGPTDLEQLLSQQVVRALGVDEQTLAAAVRAETAAQGARAAQEAANDAVDPAALRRQTLEAAKPAFPLAPNLLADTRKFATLCGGRINTETEIMTAHNGSSWSAARPPEGDINGTLEVVTLPHLAARGIRFGGDLVKAIQGPSVNNRLYSSNFHVALLDVTIGEHDEGEDANAHEHLTVLAQGGGGQFTAPNKGEFKTQASCFVNVVRHSGDIAFHLGRMSAILSAGGDLAGDGWTYLHETRDGWGHEGHRCVFRGHGSMKIALALPYIGTGDHGGAFIYASSLGRYTHGDDRLPEGVKF